MCAVTGIVRVYRRPGAYWCTCTGTSTGTATAGMDSDWLTGLLVVLMVTIAVGLLWSGTLFGEWNYV